MVSQCIQAFPHSKMCRQLISASSRINHSSEKILLKNSWELQESNPGVLDEKRECYLCAASPHPPKSVWLFALIQMTLLWWASSDHFCIWLCCFVVLSACHRFQRVYKKTFFSKHTPIAMSQTYKTIERRLLIGGSTCTG